MLKKKTALTDTGRLLEKFFAIQNLFYWRITVCAMLSVLLCLTAIGCASKVQVAVTFDDIPIGTTLGDATKIETNILSANLSGVGPPQPKIQASPVGTCGGFYSISNTLTLNPSFSTDWVAFDFAEFGGRNHITVNGITMEARDIIDLNGVAGSDYSISVAAIQEGNNWFGTTLIEGTIESLALEGQELLIDDVLFSADQDAVPHRVLINIGPMPAGIPTTYINLRDMLISWGFNVDINTTSIIDPGLLNNYDIYICYLFNRDHEDPYYGYDQQAPNSLENFVRNGGSALLLTEWGPNIQHVVAEFFLDHFSIVHDNNTVEDPTNSIVYESWVVYDKVRNFRCHPIIGRLNEILLRASSTLTDPASKVIIATDTDSVPPLAPVLLAKKHGMGRIAVIGDSFWNNLEDVYGQEYDNKHLFKNIVDWLALRR